jgi:hypothetical protein
MNSSGIWAFYGAFDIDTCIAELRPAVGETVISAKFNLSRPILVLDTTKFSGRPKYINIDLSPKFPPSLGGVLGVKSLALGRHLVHCLSLQKFHWCQVAQC